MAHQPEVHEQNTAVAQRRGWKVFAALVALTIIEYAVSALLANPLPLLAPIALAKAALIIAYFMRLGDLRVVWQEETCS